MKIYYNFCRDAGDGKLNVQLVYDELKTEVPVRILDNEDSTYTVEVIPPAVGTYTTNLIYGGRKVPFAPKITVHPVVDVSKIKVDGLEPSKYLVVFFLNFILKFITHHYY